MADELVDYLPKKCLLDFLTCDVAISKGELCTVDSWFFERLISLDVLKMNLLFVLNMQLLLFAALPLESIVSRFLEPFTCLEAV